MFANEVTRNGGRSRTCRHAAVRTALPAAGCASSPSCATQCCNVGLVGAWACSLAPLVGETQAIMAVVSLRVGSDDGRCANLLELRWFFQGNRVGLPV